MAQSTSNERRRMFMVLVDEGKRERGKCGRLKMNDEAALYLPFLLRCA
jgi:hypothetical protein